MAKAAPAQAVDHRADHGPFDIIGDVHGCFDELCILLDKLGYRVTEIDNGYEVQPPESRKVVFVGDLVDRGSKVPQVLRLGMGMVEAGTALTVPGNHDDKLMRALKGRKVQIKHGLEKTLEQIEGEPEEFCERVIAFFAGLPSHLIFDDGKLVVAHAGIRESMQGQVSERIRSFTLYGDTTGKTDEYGLPERRDWAAKYDGKALVVYGHTPVAEPRWINNTVNIDTGCVFGGALTALRYPEIEFVSVKALETYAESSRPFLPDEG